MELLEDIVGQITTRVAELRPAVDEHRELTEALAKLNGAAKAPRRGRGRPKGTGPTQDRLLAAIEANPGLTIPRIAEVLDMRPNYLYRALPDLALDGKVKQAPDGTWRLAAGEES